MQEQQHTPVSRNPFAYIVACTMYWKISMRNHVPFLEIMFRC